MTNTYKTLNPLGSTSPKDLSDNASNMDEGMNSSSPAFFDRFGKRRETWAGMEEMFSQFLVNSGFEPDHLVYVEGSPLTVIRPTQLIDYAGSVYRVKTPAAFPVNLTGTWATDSAFLVDVGDASIRQDLSNSSDVSKGAGMVARGTQVFDSVAAMRALTNAAISRNAATTGYYERGDGGHAKYYLDAADTTSPDNGADVIVSTSGLRIKMIRGVSLNPKQCGAKMDGVANDAPFAQAAIDIFTAEGGGHLDLPPGVMRINAPLTLPPSSGADCQIKITGTNRASAIVGGAAMSTLIDITGKNAHVEGILFYNMQGVADRAIRSVTDSADAGYSTRVKGCYFVGLPIGLSCSGQNYDLADNWFQNCVDHILFTDDGRNSSVSGNYMLGGNRGLTLRRVTHQAEGMRIFNNTMLVTVGNGYGIGIEAGLDIFIGHNVLDQIGPGSPGIYMLPSSGNAIAKIKIAFNWIAAGQNSYSVFAAGNCADIDMIGNSVMSNNALSALAGVSFNGVNGYKLISNNFGIVGGPDLDIAASANATVFGNTSNRSDSNALRNVAAHEMSLPEVIVNGVSISSGTGVPVTVKPNASLYLRSDGGNGGRLYVSTGASWAPVA